MLMYASSVWKPTGSTSAGLQNVQQKVARFVNNDWSWESSPTTMIKELGWLSTELIQKNQQSHDAP